MSELLIETATCQFDGQGKPIDVQGPQPAEAGQPALSCLAEQADPGANVGSVAQPESCQRCPAQGYVRDGIYYATSEAVCTRYNRGLPVITLAAAACAELCVQPVESASAAVN